MGLISKLVGPGGAGVLGEGAEYLRAAAGRKGWCPRSLLGQILLTLVSVAAPLTPAFSQDLNPKSSLTLEGKLEFVTGTGPVLKTQKKDYTLAARTSYLFHTLEDKRLLNREVRLEGIMLPDGTFKVQQLYTIRNGRLYKVRYFCETCNIEALEPGDCVCCQQPTELQEIPATASR